MSACQQSVEPTPPNLESHGWRYFAKGNYNWVYCNKAKSRVFKIQIKPFDYVDTPERSVRLWNEINSHIGQAKIVYIGSHIGWEAPFVAGEQASDEDISTYVLDLYQKTGRILVDAPSGENVLKTRDNQLVCIDIGMAVRLEQQQQRIIGDDKVWRKSFDSIRVWRESKQIYRNYFAKDFMRTHYAKTINMIKSLLLLQAVMPGLIALEFLRHNTELLQQLASIYDNDSLTVIGNDATISMIKSLFIQYKDNSEVKASTSSGLAVPLPPLQTETTLSESSSSVSSYSEESSPVFFDTSSSITPVESSCSSESEPEPEPEPEGKKARVQFKATTKAIKSEKQSNWSSHFFSSQSQEGMAISATGGCIAAAVVVCGLLTVTGVTTFGIAPAILLSIIAVSLVIASLFAGVGISMMHSQQNNPL